jgi:ribulose-5-phosphate 4-epimerase/fuculose-1-phosphate aldolase
MLMLRNHGLLTIGPTAAEAFVNMYVLEAACSIQVRAQAGGAELIEIDPRLIASAAAQSREVTKGVGAGALAWPALLRKLDRVDPSWRS